MTDQKKCYSCGGKGTYSQMNGGEMHSLPCSSCNGTGLQRKEISRCEICNSFECSCWCRCGLPHDQCVCGMKDWCENTDKVGYCPTCCKTHHGPRTLQQAEREVLEKLANDPESYIQGVAEAPDCEHGVVKKYCYNCKAQNFMGDVPVEVINQHHYVRTHHLEKKINKLLKSVRNQTIGKAAEALEQLSKNPPDDTEDSGEYRRILISAQITIRSLKKE